MAELTVQLFENYLKSGKEKLVHMYVRHEIGNGTYELLPNLNLKARVENRNVTLRTNSKGMPWHEVDYKKPAGITRIAFIGDSFTFGEWADDNIRGGFVGVFDSLLARDDIEVLNFGVPGYGYLEMAVMIREKLSRFDPDILFLMSYAGNDFENTWQQIQYYKLPSGVETSPVHIMTDTSQSDVKILPFKLKLHKYLGLYRFYGHVGNYFIIRKLKNSNPFDIKSELLSYPLKSWSKPPYNAAEQTIVDISLNKVSEIHQYCKSQGIRLYIVTIPEDAQIYSAEMSGDGFDINYPQELLRRYCADSGIVYYDLLPQLRAHVIKNQRHIYTIWNDHFNNEGHFVTGKYLVEWYLSLDKNGAN
ncbi:MAG: SGNH/GDSL hydrolase family protein [Bacteroidetes bacterium]|nr:SGNH/GDSL hydrolase family protein [Bacteroidota bacterium]